MTEIHHENCLDQLKKMEDASVDLVVTSPPYKDIDGFSYPMIGEILSELYRVQKMDSLFFLNFGHLAEDKMRPFKVCDLATIVGYKLNDTITWVKNHYKPIQGKRRLNNLTEFIFMLYKGDMPLLNRLAVGIPYADKSNAKRFSKGLDLKCGGNVWYIDYETITSRDEKLHHDRFPVELPEKCIKLCGYDVQVVLDPFCGSGTTGVAATKQGKDFIGIDMNAGNCIIAVDRIVTTATS